MYTKVRNTLEKYVEPVGRWANVQKYIAPLAELLNAEILVLDKHGVCVSGTSRYQERFGIKVQDDNALSYSLRTGESTFVLDPRCNDVCKSCSKRDGCADVANFTGPVVVDGKIVAIVQFVAITSNQRIQLLSKAEQAFDLLKHFIKFAWLHEIEKTPKITQKYNECFSGFIGESLPMQKLKQKILKIAPTESTVLIQGESGTGKELVARAIHDNSLRATKPFVPINCGAIPESLMESELFGYVGGAFSGADKNGRKGLLEQAHGGTLFLDEISEMPMSLQVKLLRALQDNIVRRVGGAKQCQIDIRVIAASNKDLHQMVQEGLFRQDLFFRLDVVPLYIPPLRERKEDIRLLTAYFLQQFSKAQHRSFCMSTSLQDVFEKHPWHGNVRELKNFVEFGVSLCENDVLTSEIMMPRFAHSYTSELNIEYDMQKNVFESPSQKKLSPKEVAEKEHIQALLLKYAQQKSAKNNIAQMLGMSLATLYRKIQKYNL